MNGKKGGRRRSTSQSAPSSATFHEEFNESLGAVLDLESWRIGRDPAREYEHIAREVREAVAAEDDSHRQLREWILPQLKRTTLVPDPGIHAVPVSEIIDTQQNLLFTGAVEACDGTNQIHDTLAVTIYQLGISLVSYGGNQGCWQQQLFRRDLRLSHGDPREAVLALLERREQRPGLHAAADDPLSELARRGVTSYMERHVLTHVAKAPWRMGHGSPAPMELVGMGFTDLVIRSIRLIRQLVAHERFVFVASEQSNRALLTLGQALFPLEYLFVDTLAEYPGLNFDAWEPYHPATEDLHWDPADTTPTPAREWVRRFRDEVATNILYGVYRATRLAPPQLFFAHKNHAHVAVRIALADSVLLEQRGFPMLIDTADRVCRSVYGGGSLRDMAEAAYVRAGAPFCYQSERATRPT